MRKGFKGFMNKVFKVVWSKSKECYVVVPEIAKNNSGKKKVLASVLAGLAVAGAMGGIAPQQAMADADYGNSHVNVWANTAPDGSNGKNDAGQNSIVVGYQNTTDHTAGNDGKVAIGAKNSATGNSAMAMGNRNVANGGAATAIGAGNESTAATTLTVGNKNNANAENAIAIGAYNNQNWTHGSWQTTPKPAGAYSLAIGNFNDALGSRATAVGAFNTAKGEWATAIGASTVASGDGDVAIGDTTKTNATGVGHAVAVGWHAETGAANAVAVGPSALASGKNSVSVGTNNNSRVQDTVTMGQDNDAKTMGGIAIGKNNMVDSTNGGTNFGETRDENSQIAIGRDNTATHLDTIAIGRDTHATGSGATVVGARADASGNNAIAIGNSGKNSPRVTASGVNSIAVGMQSQATGEATIAQGAGANAAGNFGIAVGRISKAKANYSQAYGNEATSSTMGSIAMGALAKGGNDNGTASEGGSVAVGNAAWATGNRAIAIGSIRPTEGNLKYPTGVGKDVATGLQGTDYNTQATANQAIAVGSGARTDAQNSITMGTNAKVDATANGYTYQKTNNAGVKETLTLSTDPTPTSGINNRTTYDAGNGIAIGRDSHVTGKTTSAIAIGNSALADDGAVAATVIGAGASSKSVSSVAIGTTANVQGGEGAVAVGSGATVTGNYDNASAFGSGATVNKTNGTALGAGAQTNVRGGVALGASSQADERSGAGESTGFHAANRTREYQGENKGLADNNLQLFHADIAGGDAGMVSVGNDGIKRQITNVASGTSDYDAVNVAQLRNVGVAVTGDTGKSDFLVHDGRLNVLGTGRVSTTAANDGAKDSKITVAFDDTGMVKAGKNVTVDEKTVNGRTTYTINAADAAAKYDFLTNAKANGGNLDGTAKPATVASGTTVNYAAGKNLTVKQEINQSIGEQTYTYSLNSDLGGITSITNNGGPTMHFGGDNISITGGNLDLGDHNITNLKSGGDVTNNAANIGDVTRISKANDLHIAPTAGTNNNVTEYTVDANKKVTLTYQDGNGKTVNGPKAVIDLSGLKTGDMSSFNVKSSATEGKVAQGSAGVQEIRDGKTVEMQAGKNMTIKQTNKNGNAAVEFALNKDIDLTPDGSIKIGDTNITDNGLTINNGPSITKTGINAGDLNITNVKAGVNDNDAVNVSQLKKVRADERHIKPGEYAVDNNGKVTMTYLDGNNKDVANETAVITGIAKQDLSNINKGGETVIQNLAKKSIDMENGKNTKVSNREINGVKTFKVDVEGDLNDITSITNKDGDGKVVFGGNQTVNVAGDHNINLNAKVGDITGLTNVTLDAPDFAKKGRAATEEQLKIVNNGFNNTVGLTGNTGATELQKLNKQGGLSFGVVGANNGQYITTTAAGSNVVADLSDSAKNKLNSTVVVEGKNAAKVTSNVIQNADGSTKTVYTVDVNNVKPTAASTEKVQAKADVAGSSDKNIAKVAPKAGENFGDAGATYEVNVSRNDVKDAAREAITVNTTNTTNNPITVTPVQDETNHNTTYTVTFDGNKAATQIPLTYKANGQNAQTVTLDKGLNFTNGRNTTASVDAEGVVKYDVNKDLVNINSISNTTNGPKMEFGPNSINITNGPINMGDQNITNLKSGGDVINNAANIGDVKRISKENDLHIAPTTSNRQGETTTSYAYDAASKSVTLKYNDGNGATQTGTVAKIDLSGLADQIKDGYSFSTDAKGNVVGNHAVTAVGNGKTVSYAAGDNLTVKQDIDATTGEHTYTYALSNDIKVGKDGKDGIDGKIGVNGKDGSAVVINGKDGSIGLNGKDGKDGLTIRGEKGQDGVDGKNGTNGITRIVYEDHNHDKHEVATLDDGMKYAGDDAQGADKSKVIAKKLNETMDVIGGADKSKLTDNNIGVNNVDGKLKVQLSKEVNLTPSGSLTIGDTVVNNNGLTISSGPSITKNGINAGDKFITNVKAGVNNTDAVNIAQLKEAKTEVKAGKNVTVSEDKGANGQTIYTVNANDVALGDAELKYSANGKNTQSVKLSQGLNFVDGNYTSASVDANGQVKYDVTIGKVKDGVDGKPGVDGNDGIATVKTVVDTINNSGWKGDVTGNTVNNHTATIVKPGTTVNFGAGKNLTVEQIVDRVTGDHTYNYALSDDIKVGKDGKDGVDGKIGVNGKDGSSVVINGKDGSIGLNGKDGKDGLTMKAKDGQPGVNGKDGITRIVYEDNNKNTHEVATLDDGMKYAGDDAQGTDKSKVIAKKLNQTMDIVGGANSTKLTDNNIGVNNVDGKLKVQLAQNIDLTPAGSLTIGGTSITDNGLVINQGPSITKGGINAGNKTIVNVAPGVNGTDAVNVNQLNSARTEVEEGDNVKVTSRKGANGQTIYKVSATGVNLGDAELKYSANGKNTQSVKLSQGLNFVDGNYTSASVDANGQVKYDVNLGNIKQGTDGKPGVDGKDGIATVKTVVDTINNSGWKANATGNVVGTSTATIVKPGSTVNYGAGKNLNVKQTVNGEEQTYEFALDKDLKELNSVQTNTIHLGSPTSHTTINYNAGDDRIEYTTKAGDKKQVANLDDIWTIQANGTDVKPVGGKVNVVGGDHIKVSTDAAGKMTISADGVGTMNGFNVKSTGNTTSDSDKTAKNITDGKTVEFSGGKNLTVKQTNTGDGAKVEFALKNNIDLTPNGSVTIGDTVVNNDGLTITGGPTITKNNVDMGGQQIHNVKSGGDVDSNGANIGDIKRISKANDTRIKDGNYEVSQNGTVEMTYVDGSGKQLVDEHGNPVKATISGIARQDLSNITNEGKKVITGLGTIVKAGQNVSVDEATDNTTGQKTYTVNADLSGAKVNAGVGTEGSGVVKGLRNPEKVNKGTQYIAGDNMVVERKHVEGDDKLDNSITYSLSHDLTEINSISNGGTTLRINSNPGGNKYDRDTAVTPALEVHGGNLSMTGNRIVNLAPGIDGTDGVNVNQLRDSLTTVKSTDGTVRVTDLSSDPNKHEYDLHVNPAVDPRVDKLGEEIGHVGAQSAALSALKPIQYDPMEPTQIMAGYGNYRGNSALALGVAHYKNESTMFHAGVSWAGGNGHMMANAGVTWKVGNRDSEAAVADRYRKGPISSAYAMQTEVASMKAQNAGLKGEVSDLKAENEQIKAQNAGLQSEVDQLKAQMAAMMAKLGM